MPIATTPFDKIKKHLDKLSLEQVDSVFHEMKKYSLDRFAMEMERSRTASKQLEEKINQITNGKP